MLASSTVQPQLTKLAMAAGLGVGDVLCFAIVAGSVAASLWATLLRRRLPPAAASSSSCVPPHDEFTGSTPAVWSGAAHPAAAAAWLLLASRAAAVVALAAVLLWDAVTYGIAIMMYYTEWTIVLEIVYFTIATLFSAYGCFIYSSSNNRRVRVTILPVRQSHDESVLSNSLVEINHGDDQKGGARAVLYQLGRFMQIVYQVLGGAVVLTDVVFWALIAPFMYSSRLSLNAVMGCTHSFNIVFLLIETTLNNLEFPWFRLTYFVLWTCSYVIIQWIAHGCGLTWWPYPFLNPAAPWASLWYFCIALLHLACYAVYWSIVRGKNWWLNSYIIPAY